MAVPPKPGANPKLGAVDPTASRAIIAAKRAETLAVADNTKALSANARAVQANARATTQLATATEKAAAAEGDLAKHAGAAAKVGDKVAEATDAQTGAFDGLEKAARATGRAISGVEAVYKIYVATHYDAIRAATMSARMMKEIPKTADAASERITELTDQFTKLRLKTTEVANKFIIPWDEADREIDEILTSFGAHMKLTNAGAESELTDLYGRMRSIAELTGESFQDQLRNIEIGITELGLSAESYQDQIEIMAKAPGMISKSMAQAVKDSGRYKDILKANGVIRAVQDMIHALNEENISVRKLAASYSVMIESSIKYGRTQKEAIAYAEKMTKALAGSGSATEMFDVPQFLAGQKMLASLKAEGLGAGGAKGQAAAEAKKQQFLEEMGVKAGQKATDDQDKLATQKVEHLMDLINGGIINAGAIGAEATTQDRIHAKVQSAQDFIGGGNLMDRNTFEAPKVQVLLQQILGVQEASKIDTHQFWVDNNKNNGDLEKTLTDYQEKLDKEGGLAEGEKGAAAQIAKQRLIAESLNVLFDNALGPDGRVTKILAEELKNLTSIEGAVGAMAAVVTMGAVADAQGEHTNTQSAIDALRGGQATPEDISQAQDAMDRINDKLANDKEVTAEQRVTMENNVKILSDALNQFKTGNEHRRAAISTTVQRADGTEVAPLPPDTLPPTEADAPPVGGGRRGSFRTGISNVPYDDYLAQLHEGEAVLNKQQNRTLRDAVLRAPQPTAQRSGSGSNGSGGDNDQAIMNGNMPMDAKVVGDKLVFTVNDAGGVIAQLLLQARNNNIS